MGGGQGQREEGRALRAESPAGVGRVPWAKRDAFTDSASFAGRRGPGEAFTPGSPRGQAGGHLQWGDQAEAVYGLGFAGQTRPAFTGE